MSVNDAISATRHYKNCIMCIAIAQQHALYITQNFEDKDEGFRQAIRIFAREEKFPSNSVLTKTGHTEACIKQNCCDIVWDLHQRICITDKFEGSVVEMKFLLGLLYDIYLDDNLIIKWFLSPCNYIKSYYI